ncbi:MAG TPA: ChaN family lipoprotein [Anaeromyxobacter sp.]|nr:ChaN family lipoprotein [Anaeromyxobacter sp.]
MSAPEAARGVEAARHGRGTLPAALALVAIVALGVLRVAMEPRYLPPVRFRLAHEEREIIERTLSAAAVPDDDLARALAGKRVLLLGESHFYAEPLAFATSLLEALYRVDHRPAVLLLELPGGAQRDLDRYLASGAEASLAAAWDRSDTLPYQKLVRWARAHPDLVHAVVAFDEDPARIFLMRALGTDTRNGTMADAVLRAAREHPDDRVVVYGGRFHVMLAGRYLYDSETRSPIGERLLSAGLPRSELAAVWVYAGEPPAAGLWPRPGAISLAGAAGALPVALFEPEPIARASRLDELVDYAVYLGPGTRIEGR